MQVSLSEIADLVQGQVVGDSDLMISGVAPFEQAGEHDISVAGNAKFLKKINDCHATAIIVPKDTKVPGLNLLQVDNPMVAFAKALQLFQPPVQPLDGIHPRAEIGRKFKHGRNISIGPLVVIGHHVSVGDQVWLHPGVVIGDNVSIGNDVIIHPNVSIQERTIIGSRVIIHSGTVIGSDGFGFAPDGTTYHKIPHTGIVQIDDDVEIGANNAIDRGTFGKTHIGRGVKTDNLVHLAHNVTVGENTVLVAQVGISGSVTIGKNAILAGQAGVAGHLTIGDNATVGPKTGVGKPVPDGQIVSAGIPEMPHRLWLRVVRTIPKLPDISKRLLGLEKRLKNIEEKLD
ncbi:MAG: UDP-3-O-(3-hydroxymyristoyl)glucosamine N-acyltransferase [Deltaproteobacteria bacterium]|jgi:UDP-3-O-[3-hydroxymyristoyl] glucosamine N-acyltransferase|nr:UDP-3-O-(3-hydroxymyristoyl)glucosamine N-acyltransferase [Deltaproteobacteria bacterium]